MERRQYRFSPSPLKSGFGFFLPAMPDSHAKEDSTVLLSKLANCYLDNYKLWQAGLSRLAFVVFLWEDTVDDFPLCLIGRYRILRNLGS